MGWLKKRREHKARTPLNNTKATLGHLRALIAAQSGQLATIETQIGILHANSLGLQHTTHDIYRQVEVIENKIERIHNSIFEVAEKLGS